MEYKKTVTLDVDDGGSNSLPVVFLHGLAGNTSQWKHQLAHLRSTRRAIALNLRGHGQSPIPIDGNYDIEVMAKDVTATLDRLEVKQSTLVGHSAGAAVAIACTREEADRVTGLLLVDPVGDQRRLPEAVTQDLLAALASEAYQFTIEKWWEEILRGAHESSRESILANLRSTPPSVVLGWFRALLEFDPVAPLRRYRGPVLSVITPFNNASFSLHNLMPALRHVLVTGTSHWPHMDKPNRVNQILDDFLKEVEAN